MPASGDAVKSVVGIKMPTGEPGCWEEERRDSSGAS